MSSTTTNAKLKPDTVETQGTTLFEDGSRVWVFAPATLVLLAILIAATGGAGLVVGIILLALTLVLLVDSRPKKTREPESTGKQASHDDQRES